MKNEIIEKAKQELNRLYKENQNLMAENIKLKNEIRKMEVKLDHMNEYITKFVDDGR